VSECHSKVIVALDFDNEKQLDQLLDQLSPTHCRLKVGKEMFTYFGPKLVTRLVSKGFDVFLDLKFHDIPNTVAKACIAAADLGVWMVNVHASGGEKMMLHAKTELDKRFTCPPKLIAVTVLTSMDQFQLDGVVGGITLKQQVLRLAELSQRTQLDGVVCSALEAQLIRQHLGKSFTLVTPGIRPLGFSEDDQTRIVTPTIALNYGVDYMVIGRPITQSDDPIGCLKRINEEINQVS
jgi:orotidine-5'-phosphate decarboxylase